MQEYLFVYGTLRKEYRSALHELIQRSSLLCQPGKVRARLYDLGEYPGAVPEKADFFVSGEIYALIPTLSDVLFRALDYYEGEEFCRSSAEAIVFTEERIIKVWIYWYTGEVQDKKLIPSGDYFSLPD